LYYSIVSGEEKDRMPETVVYLALPEKHKRISEEEACLKHILPQLRPGARYAFSVAPIHSDVEGNKSETQVVTIGIALLLSFNR
jgi:hypothetical protein